MDKPLLLVDVDGVISLFGFDRSEPPDGRFELIDGIAHFLSAGAGDHLRALSAEFELVWCTGWEEKANEYLPRALGIPRAIPHLTFERDVGRSHAHWKLAAIEAYAGSNRPLAWIDDALDDACVEWAAARPGPTLLITTLPAVGITAQHVAKLLEWAEDAVSRPARLDARASRSPRHAGGG
jgi:hypothetical protein